MSKSAFWKGVGHFERKFQTEGDVAGQPLLVSENLSDCSFAISKYPQCIVWFVTKHACDGQTDR